MLSSAYEMDISPATTILCNHGNVALNTSSRGCGVARDQYWINILTVIKLTCDSEKHHGLKQTSISWMNQLGSSRCDVCSLTLIWLLNVCGFRRLSLKLDTSADRDSSPALSLKSLSLSLSRCCCLSFSLSLPQSLSLLLSLSHLPLPPRSLSLLLSFFLSFSPSLILSPNRSLPLLLSLSPPPTNTHTSPCRPLLSYSTLARPVVGANEQDY